MRWSTASVPGDVGLPDDIGRNDGHPKVPAPPSYQSLPETSFRPELVPGGVDRIHALLTTNEKYERSKHDRGRRSRVLRNQFFPWIETTDPLSEQLMRNRNRCTF